MKYLKIPLAISSAFFLGACSDDSDNAALVAALEEQNQILSEQQQEQNPTVAIRGIVVDQFDDLPVDQANVVVKIGEETLAEATASQGTFEVSGLPVNSDVEIIVSSDSDEFMTRVFYFDTGYSNSGEAQKDYGEFAVSEATDLTLMALNYETDEVVTGLSFNAYPHYGTGSSSSKYTLYSSYDEVAQVYTISLPKYIETNVNASLDIDNNGVLDYTHEVSGYSSDSISLYQANEMNSETLYLARVKSSEDETIEYRISVVSSDGQPISSAELNVDDDLNQDITSTYDQDSGQHVLSAIFHDSIDIHMAAFTEGSIFYEAASISIDKQTDGSLRVYFSNTDNDSYYYFTESSETIELALNPDEATSADTQLELVFASNEVGNENQFIAFYSQPITVLPQSVTLVNQNGFTVVKGNADNNDLVLPGTTLITGGVEAEITTEMSLNDTRLVVTPVSDLEAYTSYTYSVGSVMVKSTGLSTDLYSDQLSFLTDRENESFDINDLYLDNNNYTFQGNRINTLNTAGEASSSTNNDTRTYIILPDSVLNLQNFTLRKVVVTEDGVSVTDPDTYEIVENGTFRYSSNDYGLLSLAENENIESSSLYISMLYGASLADAQRVYAISTYEYISDDLTTAENSISFEYAYETLEGEISTGTITLPVN